MWEALAAALAAGLGLWQSLEKRKYLDKLIQLKADYREEYNKDLSIRSDARLDDLRAELCELSFAFSSALGAADAPNKP